VITIKISYFQHTTSSKVSEGVEVVDSSREVEAVAADRSMMVERAAGMEEQVSKNRNSVVEVEGVSCCMMATSKIQELKEEGVHSLN